MIAPKGREGAPVPLFDRLVDADPSVSTEAVPFRTLDRAGLRASVRREVERLLNTRAPLPEAELGKRERTVIDYGIPDFGTFTTPSGVDKHRLAQIIARHIAIFEPRLRDVTVEVEDFRRHEGRLIGRVDATMVAGTIVEPVSFPVVVRRDEVEGRG